MTPETAAALDRVGVLLDRLIGLRADPTLRSRLSRCVVDAAASRAMTVERYVDSLPGDDAGMQDLCDRVTVQETGFFRHPDQFRTLVDHVLPNVPGPVRIWCAASANGQEPYSLAMVLAEQGRTGGVLATDISTTALRRTAAARYSEREITMLSPARRAAHLSAVEGGWQVVDGIRKTVSVQSHNLLRPVPAHIASCQIVFCRNVLIYLTPEHRAHFLERLADVVAPGSYLFVGSAETIRPGDRYDAVYAGGTFVYRARARGLTVQPPTPVAPRRFATKPATVASPDRRSPRRPVAPPAGTAGPVIPPAEAAREAARTGDPAAAVTAFRRWAYLEPDDPQAHLHLALALEAMGDDRAARRAFRSARAALDHADPARLDAALGHYDVAELHRLLAEKGRA
ncbi:MAG TPA: CheR family methyltransferase [Micromonosporaceae bacterium]|nr:CheR family methyltransferase [Micromonosporaceae bacterium]